MTSISALSIRVYSLLHPFLVVHEHLLSLEQPFQSLLAGSEPMPTGVCPHHLRIQFRSSDSVSPTHSEGLSLS